MAAIVSKATGSIILNQQFHDQSATQKHELGLVIPARKGRRFLYLQYGEAVTRQGSVVAVTGTTFQGLMLTTTIANQGPPWIGVSAYNGATTSAYYGWIALDKQDDGEVDLGIDTLASDAADIIQYSTATAGAIDDSATTQIIGVRLSTATGGAQAVNYTSAWKNMQAIVY